MRQLLIAATVIAIAVTANLMRLTADEAGDQAAQKDRQQIAGLWRAVAVEVEGKSLPEEDVRKISVVNDTDGTWKLFSDRDEFCRGTNSFSTSKTGKSIDFSITAGDGAGKKFVGIYELGDQSRKLCFGPADLNRPSEFSTSASSQTILVKLVRDKEDSIRRERERIIGAWQATALVVDGKEADAEDVKKILVLNDADGTWRIMSDGEEIIRGTNAFDPTQSPKAIDLTVTTGENKGNKYLAIYELGETTRRLCIAEHGRERPTSFTVVPGSQQVSVTLERVKSK